MKIRIGILGAGQLGMMAAMIGEKLGIRFRLFDTKESCGARVAHQYVGDYKDREAIERFCKDVDVVTYEFENVDSEALKQIAEAGIPIYPPINALEVFQDRWKEKNFFYDHGVPTAGPFSNSCNQEELMSNLRTAVFPQMLKTTRFGYDGKGQQRLEKAGDISYCTEMVAKPCILEPVVEFSRELSLAAVKGTEDKIIFYPMAENYHHEGKIRLSIGPAPAVSQELEKQAHSYLRRLIEALHYRGILVVEFFQVGDELIANEAAPRPHNSYHGTIDGTTVSQFENFVRAVSGLPLKEPEVKGHYAMINCIDDLPEFDEVFARDPEAKPLYYGKAIRPTKLGHINIVADSAEALAEKVKRFNGLPGIWLPREYR